MDSSGHIVLTDFGLSKEFDEVRQEVNMQNLQHCGSTLLPPSNAHKTGVVLGASILQIPQGTQPSQ